MKDSKLKIITLAWMVMVWGLNISLPVHFVGEYRNSYTLCDTTLKILDNNMAITTRLVRTDSPQAEVLQRITEYKETLLTSRLSADEHSKAVMGLREIVLDCSSNLALQAISALEEVLQTPNLSTRNPFPPNTYYSEGFETSYTYEKTTEVLNYIAKERPEVISSNTISALESLLRRKEVSFYSRKEAGEVLVSIVQNSQNTDLIEEVFSTLKSITKDPEAEYCYDGVLSTLEDIVTKTSKINLARRAFTILENLANTRGLNSKAYGEIASSLHYILRNKPESATEFVTFRTVSSLENIFKIPEIDSHCLASATGAIGGIAQNWPELVTLDTVNLLKKTFEPSRSVSYELVSYSYNDVLTIAGALVSITKYTQDSVSTEALSILEKLFVSLSSNNVHRAVSEALGNLPLSIQGPELDFSEKLPKSAISIQEILTQVASFNPTSPRFISRSLVYDLDNGEVLIIKLLRENEEPEKLIREGKVWKYLKQIEQEGAFSEIRFDIPEIIELGKSLLFKLEDIPAEIPESANLHKNKYAIAFRVSKDYFSYPNLPEERIVFSYSDEFQEGSSKEEFKEIISRNAYLLGYLASLGIFHTDVIPLFHNRASAGVRGDRGLYQWWLRGRLDRWLFSCDYPNFGVTGLRDAEHFISWNIDEAPLGYDSNLGLYRLMGTQLLGLLLTTGSYFRNADRMKVGLDSRGNPVDAKDLFDKELLKEIVKNIFTSYYEGFTREKYMDKLPFDLDYLVESMVEKMGVDNDMEEILRAETQQQMTDEEFIEFYRERGYSEEEMDDILTRKGKRDMPVLSGPHLGSFNAQISLPEMIDAIARMSALNILSKYKIQNIIK